jgi:hypothetical protein
MNPNPFDQPVDPNSYQGPPAAGNPFVAPDPNLPAVYAQPGYPPAPTYQQPGYPPAPYPLPVYPQTGYQPYPQPGPYGYPPAVPAYYPQPGNGRPGVVVAAAVLGYVVAGFLILSGFLLLIGASAVDGIDDTYGNNSGTTKFLLSGVANLVSSGFLIAGGVMLTSRQPRGRAMYAIGSAVCIGAGVFWLTVSLGSIIWVIIYCAPVIIGTIFIYGVSTARWMGLTPSAPPAPPYPQQPPQQQGPGPYGY